MKKIHLLFIFFLLISTSVKAQVGEPVDPQKDKREIDGFTVRLKPAPSNTYLFDILNGETLLYSKPTNPFNLKPEGLDKKEDAFNVAKWLLNEYKISKLFPPIVPPHVALELNITIKN